MRSPSLPPLHDSTIGLTVKKDRRSGRGTTATAVRLHTTTPLNSSRASLLRSARSCRPPGARYVGKEGGKTIAGIPFRVALNEQRSYTLATAPSNTPFARTSNPNLASKDSRSQAVTSRLTSVASCVGALRCPRRESNR